MGAIRRIRRAEPPRSIACGPTEREQPPEAVAPASPTAEARVVTLRGGTRWLVTLVARLVSEDTASGTESARLVLRFECLTHPTRPVRVATVSARELHAVDDETLRALASVPAVRARYAALQRLEKRGRA